MTVRPEELPPAGRLFVEQFFGRLCGQLRALALAGVLEIELRQIMTAPSQSAKALDLAMLKR